MTFTQSYPISTGSADYLGLNHYTTNRAKHHVCDESEVGYYCDMEVQADQDPAWPR